MRKPKKARWKKKGNQPPRAGVDYSNREKTSVDAKNLPDALRQTFKVLFETQFKDVFDVLLETELKPLRAFADFYSKGMSFKLQILGFNPFEIGLILPYDGGDPMQSAEYEKHMFAAHENLVGLIIERMRQANAVQDFSEIVGDAFVFLSDREYCLQIRWNCKPSFLGIMQNARNN